MTRLPATLCLFTAALFTAAAQTAAPTMTVVADDGTETDETAYDGSAPMTAVFRANPSDLGEYEGHYEWRFTRQGESSPFIVRYDEETRYTFAESGTFTVELAATFVNGADTVNYEGGEAFTIVISESKLELPNAFTPNGDGYNDVYRVKEGYQSIVSFSAAVFNRWGRKLYEWTDLEGGWDGRSGGHDCPDGAYYLVVKARGADGRNYNVKKVINILRGYSENTGSSVTD